MKVRVLLDDEPVFDYQITIRGMNYAPTEAEYFAEAKRMAIEDGLVPRNSGSRLRFQLLED